MDPGSLLRGRYRGRLPRAGGDGPPARRRSLGWQEAPPRRRGWTLRSVLVGCGECGSPAQAGMDPRHASKPRTGTGLPRAGGDGPLAPRRRGYDLTAPPRRRGWTRLGGLRPGLLRGSPAQAGMDLLREMEAQLPGRLPRAGGDGPSTGGRGSAGVLAPPRRRGWTRQHPYHNYPYHGSPAQAGMDPQGPVELARDLRLPRAGGDGPRHATLRARRQMAPPRRRGWTHRSRSQTDQSTGSPAQAGMDPTR